MSGVDEITCPLCGDAAWPSVRRYGLFAAMCGTVWSEGGAVDQSPACVRLMRLELDAGLRGVLAGGRVA
jgi:hypothetical protein